MLIYGAQRLAQGVLTLLGVSLVVFLALHLVPGDPALILAGPQAGADEVRLLRERYRLDEPIPAQYVDWLMRIARGDFGNSFRGGRPVWGDIADAYPISLRLASLALLLTVVVGIPLGILAAVRRQGVVDAVVMGVAVVGISMPTFWLALMLVLLFSLELRLLPSSGWGGASHYVLPVFCLSLSSLALVARLTRSVMVEALQDDYVRTAHAKGLGYWAVCLRHALRNALPPIVTVLGLRFGLLAGGAVIIETVFAIPGMGSLIVRAVSARDFPVIQGGVLVIAVTVWLANLVVDLLYAALDPRVRYA